MIVKIEDFMSYEDELESIILEKEDLISSVQDFEDKMSDEGTKLSKFFLQVATEVEKQVADVYITDWTEDFRKKLDAYVQQKCADAQAHLMSRDFDRDKVINAVSKLENAIADYKKLYGADVFLKDELPVKLKSLTEF